MKMNPGIILAGQQPDIVNALEQSTRAAQAHNAVTDQNALRTLYQEQGPGIVSGNQSSVNQLARLDPFAAQSLRSEQANQRRADEQIRLAQQEAAREATRLARAGKAQEAAEALRREVDLLSGLMPAYQQGPEAFNAVIGQLGNPAVNYENFPAWLAGSEAGLEVLGRMQTVRDFNAPPKASAKEDEIRRTMAAWGVDYQTAQGIADGVIRASRHPVDGSTVFVNLADQTVADPNSAPGSQPVTEPAQQPGLAETAKQPQQRPYAFPETIPGMQDSFGIEGTFKRGVNTAAGVFGGTAYPDVQNAQAELAVIGESVTRGVMAAYRRQPPAFVLQAIRDLFPKGANPLVGSPEALSKLRALRNELQRNVTSIDGQMSRRMSNANREKLRAQMTGAQDALTSIDTLIHSLGGGSSEGATSSGVKWSIEP